MAHALGLRMVAEGVEDDGHRGRAASTMGVDVLQGYHLARPMPPEHLLGWLDDRREAMATVPSA